MRALLEFGRSILPRSPARQLELEREILEELQFHLDCRAEANRECGQSADEARARALKQFGDPELILDACIDARDAHPGRRALRLAARVLPIGMACGFAAAVLITLYALMIRLPASYPAEGHWAVVWWKHVETGLLRADSSIDDFEAWRGSARTAEYVSLAEYRPVVSRLNGTSERLTGKYVAGDYLREHGIQPVIGRTFSSDAPDAVQRPILISHQFWERRFRGSDSALGREIDVDGVSHTIVGVAPEEYQTYFPFDFFAPVDFEGRDRSRRRYLVSIRVRPGVTVEEAQREFAAIDPVGVEKSGWHVHMRRPQEVYGGGYPRHLAPYAIVALMLLVVAVTRARLNPPQAGGSAFLLAIAGIVLVGIGTAFAAIELLRNTALTGVDQRFNFTPDGTAALAFVAVTLLAVALSGPRIRLNRPEVRRRRRAGGAIEVSPALAITTALAFLMLATAVTLTHDWWRSRSPNVGLDVERIFTLPVLLPAAGLVDREERREFFRTTAARIDEIESIEQYSFTSGFPTITEPPRVNALLPDPDALGSEKWVRIAARGVGPDFFETVGIRVLSGEPYHVDARDEAVRLAVVSSALAARYWPDQNAIGKRIKLYEADAAFEITAVVENAVSMTPGDEQEPMLYPLIWHWMPPSTMVVRTSHAYSEVATEIREAFASANPDATVGEIVPGDAGLRSTARTRGVTATLFWAFGLLALALSASLTSRSVSTAANHGVRAISLRRSVQDLKDVGLGPLFAAVVAGLVAGGALSAPFSDLMARELSLDGQAGVLRVALPAFLLITMHAAVAYIPIRQFARLEKTRRFHRGSAPSV